MLEDSTVLPIVRIFGPNKEELSDWEGATAFLAGPHFTNPKDLKHKKWYEVQLDALTIAEVAN